MTTSRSTTVRAIARRAIHGAALLALVSANMALASSSSLGTISSVMGTTYGVTFFSQSGARSQRPACATQDRWVINTSSSSGQALYATMMTAFATGKLTTVEGTGNCSDWPDTEGVQYLVVNN